MSECSWKKKREKDFSSNSTWRWLFILNNLYLFAKEAWFNLSYASSCERGLSPDFGVDIFESTSMNTYTARQRCTIEESDVKISNTKRHKRENLTIPSLVGMPRTNWIDASSPKILRFHFAETVCMHKKVNSIGAILSLCIIFVRHCFLSSQTCTSMRSIMTTHRWTNLTKVMLRKTHAKRKGPRRLTLSIAVIKDDWRAHQMRSSDRLRL